MQPAFEPPPLPSAGETASPNGSRRQEPPGFVLADPAMCRLDAAVTDLAAGKINILILGETGVGKEILSQTIHGRSPRRDRPFLRINCGALSAGLLDSELFGHEKGAFTGAVRARPGLLEAASGGTLFLDEVGEMPPALQVKLLRALEEGAVIRVGGTRGRPVDVRVVSATNRDLEQEVAAQRFRKDLFYRLGAAILEVPPLRARPSEIEALAVLFIERAARELGRPCPRLSAPALVELQRHDWPGNVRELRNVVERALLLCKGSEITAAHLPPLAGTTGGGLWASAVAPASEASAAAVTTALGDERARVVEALNQCAGNQTRAARLLGISRGTLVARLVEYGLPRPRKRRSLG